MSNRIYPPVTSEEENNSPSVSVPPYRVFRVTMDPIALYGCYDPESDDVMETGVEAHVVAFAESGALVFYRYRVAEGQNGLYQQLSKAFAPGTWLDVTDVSDQFKSTGISH